MTSVSSSSARQLPSRIAAQLAQARSLNARLNAFTYLSPPEGKLLGGAAARSLAAGRPVDRRVAGGEGHVRNRRRNPYLLRLADASSPFDATVVRRLRDAGALLLGKTNMDEFGMGSGNVYSHYGPVLNPAGPNGPEKTLAQAQEAQRVAGGSSGGSAAAVAAGLCDVALASDTGGSTRLPASYCGVLGFKPSYGLLSRYGLVAYASSLDNVGLMSREVGLLRRTFDVINAYDPRDPTSAPVHARRRADKVHRRLRDRLKNQAATPELPLQGIRIGVPADIFPASLLASAALLDPIRSFLRTLASLGASLSSVRLPSAPLGLSAYYVLASAEASSNLARYDGVQFGYRATEEKVGEKEQLYARTRTEGFGKEVRKRLLLGTYALSADAFDNYYLQAQRVRRLIQLELDHTFRAANPLSSASDSAPEKDAGIDFLVHPSAMSTAPLLSSYAAGEEASPTRAAVPAIPSQTAAPHSAYLQDLLTVPASLAGLPALSLPAGRASDDGWPVGVTLVGQWGSDGQVLEVARRVEEHRRGS